MDEVANNNVKETTLSKVEGVKLASDRLRGTLQEELANGASYFTTEGDQILKHHGAYQQDHRDLRKSGAKQYSFLVRTRFPGGKLTSSQLLMELDLCDELGDGTLRITDRQGFQLHGVLKQDLKEVIQRIDRAKLTTMGACGDVVRNVMCCPAPLKGSPIRQEMQRLTDKVSEHFSLRSRAYYEIWLKSEEESEQVGGQREEENGFYGATYLPRKFKFAFALPEDNCVDALTHDVGFFAVDWRGKSPYFNVYVGGGMGVTPARADTFAAVAQPFALVSAEELIPLSQAIVQVQKEHGNRSDRKRARFKYLVADWGLERLREEVERNYGQRITPPESLEIQGMQSHLGWHEQPDGKWFLGVRVEAGRIKDDETIQLKSALRRIAMAFAVDLRLTALQDILLCNIAAKDRLTIEHILSDHGIAWGEQVPALRQLAIACPALPTCGLAITESERVMPTILGSLQKVLDAHQLSSLPISIRMTGCPNGCTRPYVAEIALVGKAVNKYTLYLGGSQAGNRLAFKFQDMLTPTQIVSVLDHLLGLYVARRIVGESFGDFCFRQRELLGVPQETSVVAE